MGDPIAAQLSIVTDGHGRQFIAVSVGGDVFRLPVETQPLLTKAVRREHLQSLVLEADR